MIRIEHLQKKYNTVEALKDVNAVIENGEVISIIGPSGTGKSTLLRCINMLEKPTSGKIWLDDIEITNPKNNISLLRRKIGMVFQSFNLFDHLSVLDNVMVGPIKILGMSPQKAEEQALKLLSQVGMLNRIEAFPSELSGGQKQRVAIARALSMQPEVILFDEPTSALDPNSVSEVLSVIRDVAKQGITMLIVTHEMKFAKNVSSRILYLDQGIVYEDGTPDEIFNNPQKELTKIFINRTHSLDYHITDGSYDNYELLNNVLTFCIHYGLKGSIIDRISHIVEEVLSLCFEGDIKVRNNIIMRKGGIDFCLSYSEENEQAIITISAPEELHTVLRNDSDIDGISYAIINGMSQSVEEGISNGKLNVNIKVNCKQ